MARFVGSFTPPPTESDCRSHTNGDAVCERQAWLPWTQDAVDAAKA